MTETEESRVPVIKSKDQLEEQHHHHFELIEETRGGVRGPFSVLLNSPEAAGRIANVGTYLRYESTLSDKIRELSILTTAREQECAYEWAAHEPIAQKENLDEETIEVVLKQQSVDDLPKIDALVILFGRELFQEHEISDALFDEIRNRLGVQGVTELAATMGYYALLATVLNAFEVKPASDVPIFE